MWLAFMVAAFIAGQFATGPGVQQYDPGQAGRAEQVLTNLGVVTPPAESVLIEARTDEKQLTSDAAAGLRHAAAEVKRVTLQVEAALAALPQAADQHPGTVPVGCQQPGPGGRARHRGARHVQRCRAERGRGHDGAD